MIIFLILGLLLGGLVVIFALQNVTTIDVVFLTWQIQGSLALILVLAVVIGMILTWLFYMPEMIHRRFQILKLKDANKKLESDLADKRVEVEAEKGKVAATNAYVDDLESKGAL